MLQVAADRCVGFYRLAADQRQHFNCSRKLSYFELFWLQPVDLFCVVVSFFSSFDSYWFWYTPSKMSSALRLWFRLILASCLGLAKITSGAGVVHADVYRLADSCECCCWPNKIVNTGDKKTKMWLDFDSICATFSAHDWRALVLVYCHCQMLANWLGKLIIKLAAGGGKC